LPEDAEVWVDPTQLQLTLQHQTGCLSQRQLLLLLMVAQLLLRLLLLLHLVLAPAPQYKVRAQIAMAAAGDEQREGAQALGDKHHTNNAFTAMQQKQHACGYKVKHVAMLAAAA
jgi:hypothetical protein